MFQKHSLISRCLPRSIPLRVLNLNEKQFPIKYTSSNAINTLFTSNLTIRQISKPGFSPAPFQAFSVSAAAFFTCNQA